MTKNVADADKKILVEGHRGTHVHKTMTFPKGFLWGTATSAHQVEGMNIHNDWWLFEQEKGNIWDDQVSGLGPDHYHLYEKDFDIAEKVMHNNAYRFSVEWSRIEPRPGNYDQIAIEHYKNMLRDLKARGFTVMLTLHHFTLPQWVAEKGGWNNADTITRFEAFTEICAHHFAPWVDLWCTINEPVIYAYAAHIWAEWPPKQKSRLKMYRTIKNLAKAHIRSYQKIHYLLDTEKEKAQVGFAKNFFAVSSHRRHSFFDQMYMLFVDKFQNHYFYDLIKEAQDFLGINYYFYQRVQRGKKKMSHEFVDAQKQSRETSDLGWEIYPQGIYEVLYDISSEIKLPVYITENGIASVNDDKRVRFLIEHLREVYYAIQAGIDVRGYFHWSLLDNFEWNKGYTPKFGLVDVDLTTLERTPKKSATVYGDIAQHNGITHDVLRYLGHGVE